MDIPIVLVLVFQPYRTVKYRKVCTERSPPKNLKRSDIAGKVESGEDRLSG